MLYIVCCDRLLFCFRGAGFTCSNKFSISYKRTYSIDFPSVVDGFVLLDLTSDLSFIEECVLHVPANILSVTKECVQYIPTSLSSFTNACFACLKKCFVSYIWTCSTYPTSLVYKGHVLHTIFILCPVILSCVLSLFFFFFAYEIETRAVKSAGW